MHLGYIQFLTTKIKVFCLLFCWFCHFVFCFVGFVLLSFVLCVLPGTVVLRALVAAASEARHHAELRLRLRGRGRALHAARQRGRRGADRHRLVPALLADVRECTALLGVVGAARRPPRVRLRVARSRLELALLPLVGVVLAADRAAIAVGALVLRHGARGDDADDLRLVVGLESLRCRLRLARLGLLHRELLLGRQRRVVLVGPPHRDIAPQLVAHLGEQQRAAARVAHEHLLEGRQRRLLMHDVPAAAAAVPLLAVHRVGGVALPRAGAVLANHPVRLVRPFCLNGLAAAWKPHGSENSAGGHCAIESFQA